MITILFQILHLVEQAIKEERKKSSKKLWHETNLKCCFSGCKGKLYVAPHHKHGGVGWEVHVCDSCNEAWVD